MAIKVTHNGKEVIKYVGRLDTSVGRGIAKGIAKATLVMESASVKEAPKGATARLSGGIHSTIDSTQGVVSANVKYAKYVHEGTKPHYVSGEKLKMWARKKGLNPYTVAKGIQRRGTKANPFFDRAFSKNLSKASRTFEKEITKSLNNTK